MKHLLILFALLLVSSSAFAARNYRAQGCGLGSLLFTDDNILHNVLGSITNTSSGNQTFGMSTGTIGCDPGRGGLAIEKKRRAALYIEANRVALSNDMARGRGETLGGICEIYGCTNPLEVAPVLKKNYSNIFSDGFVSSEQVAQNISEVLENTPACL